MEEIYRKAYNLKKVLAGIVYDLYTNNPGVNQKKQVQIDVISQEIGGLMAQLSTLRADLLNKYKRQEEESNNAKYL